MAYRPLQPFTPFPASTRARTVSTAQAHVHRPCGYLGKRAFRSDLSAASANA